MKAASFVAVATLFTATAVAQATEIAAMTVSFSNADMDNLPGGVVTLQDVRDAGDNGGAPIAAIALTPNPSSGTGFYNVNIGRGRALGLNTTGSMARIETLAFFSPFDLQVDLEVPASEFGLEVGDWLDSMIIDFSYQGRLLGSIQTTPFQTAQPKFFAFSGIFDSVTVRSNTAQGNWVLPGLYIQNATAWQPFGQGCAGSNGVPTLQLVSAPEIGSVFALDIINAPVTGGLWLMTFGQSNTNDPIFGPLPADLTPLGAPGCMVLTEVIDVILGSHGGNTASYSVVLPNLPQLTGLVFMNQGYFLDSSANSLGVSNSDGSISTIQ